MISANDIQFYRETGYLVLHDFFDRSVIAEMGQA